MNDVNRAKHGNNSSYYAPTSAPPAAAYPNAFQSGELDSRLARNNTNNINRANNVDTLKDGMKGNNHWATAAPPDPGCPSGFHIGEIDLNSARIHTNTMSNPNNVAYTNTTTKFNGEKGRSCSPKTAPAVAGYPSAFHSAEIGSSSTLSNIQNGVYDTNSMTNATSAYKGNRGNYNSSTATPAIAGYPSVFPSTRVDSSSDSTNIVHNTNVANNRKKTDYHSNVAPPITMRSGDFELGEIDLNSNSNRTNTVGNLNNMTHARIVENGEKGRCRSPTESLAVAEYPNSFHSGKIDSSSTGTNTKSKLTNMNSARNVRGAKEGKKGNYSTTAAALENVEYPRVVPSSEIGSSSENPNRTIDRNVANNGNKNNYHSITAAPAVPTYSSGFRCADIDSSYTPNNRYTGTKANSSNKVTKGNYRQVTAEPACPTYFQSREFVSNSNPFTAAWEEHIDENTNRKFFYNCITGMVSRTRKLLKGVCFFSRRLFLHGQFSTYLA